MPFKSKMELITLRVVMGAFGWQKSQYTEVEIPSNNVVSITIMHINTAKDFNLSRHLDDDLLMPQLNHPSTPVISSSRTTVSHLHEELMSLAWDDGCSLHQDCNRAVTSINDTGSDTQLRLKNEALRLNGGWSLREYPIDEGLGFRSSSVSWWKSTELRLTMVEGLST